MGFTQTCCVSPNRFGCFKRAEYSGPCAMKINTIFFRYYSSAEIRINVNLLVHQTREYHVCASVITWFVFNHTLWTSALVRSTVVSVRKVKSSQLYKFRIINFGSIHSVGGISGIPIIPKRATPKYIGYMLITTFNFVEILKKKWMIYFDIVIIYLIRTMRKIIKVPNYKTPSNL